MALVDGIWSRQCCAAAVEWEESLLGSLNWHCSGDGQAPTSFCSNSRPRQGVLCTKHVSGGGLRVQSSEIAIFGGVRSGGSMAARPWGLVSLRLVAW